MQLSAALLKVVLTTENSGVPLHSLLHTGSNLRGRRLTSAVADGVQVRDRLLTSILWEVSLGLTRRE